MSNLKHYLIALSYVLLITAAAALLALAMPKPDWLLDRSAITERTGLAADHKITGGFR
jgi:hypothetical protein